MLYNTKPRSTNYYMTPLSGASISKWEAKKLCLQKTKMPGKFYVNESLTPVAMIPVVATLTMF